MLFGEGWSESYTWGRILRTPPIFLSKPLQTPKAEF
jgi:hypothetical protein